MRSCEAKTERQIEDTVRAAAFKAMIDRLISQIQDGFGNFRAWVKLNQEVRDAVAYLTGKGEEESRYRAFKKMFRSGLEKDIETAVNEAVSRNPGASAEDVAEVKTAWLEDEMKEEKVRAAYNQMEERSRAEGVRYYPGVEYLKDLSHRVVTSGGIDMVQEGLTVFAAYGGAEDADKKKGAEILRTDLLDVTDKCVAAVEEGELAAGQENACVSALKDVSGLSVLGERGESEDAAAIHQFFDKGYNSAFGGYIIMTSVPALHMLGAGNYILDVMDKAGAKKVAASGLGQTIMQASDGSDQAISPYVAGTWVLGLEGSLYQTESGELRSAWTDAGAYLGKAAADGDAVAGWIIDNHAGRTVGFEEHNRWRYGVSFTFPSFTAGVLEGGSYKRIVDKLRGKNGYERVKQFKNNSGGTWRDYLFLALYDHNKIDLDVTAWNDVNNRLVEEWRKDPDHARGAVSVSMDGSGSASGSGASWQNMVYREELPHNMQEQVKCVYILNDAISKIGVMIDALGILMLADGLVAITRWGWTKAFNIKMARMGELGRGVKLYDIKNMHQLLRAHSSQRAAYFAQRGQALVAEGERLAAGGNAAAAESYLAQAELMAAKATRFTPFMGVDRGAVVFRQVTRARQGVNVAKTMNTINAGAAEVQELVAQGNLPAAGARLRALRNEVSAMQRAGVGNGKAYTKSQFQRAQQNLKDAEGVFADANAADALQGVVRVRNAFAANDYHGAYEALNSLRSQVAAIKEARAGKNKIYSKEQYQQARTALSEAESVFGRELEAARTNLLAKARLEGKGFVELPQYEAAENRIVMAWTAVEPVNPGVKPTLGKSFSDWWLEKRLGARVSLEDFRRSMQAIINRPVSFAKNMAVAFSLNVAPLQADAAVLFENPAHTITLGEAASRGAAEGAGTSVGGARVPLNPSVAPLTPMAVTPENWRLINRGNFWRTSIGQPLTFGERTLFAVQGLTPRFVWDYQRDLNQWNLLNRRYMVAGATDDAESGWSGSIAFNQYQQQLNNWLYRSNPLYRAQNPWLVGNLWSDIKTSISLGWQEFNLDRYGNPDYMNYVASLPTSQSSWATRHAFNNYSNQAVNWLYRSNPLYRAQNPWSVAHWWGDIKNFVSLGWQEFNLTRAGNPDYTRLEDSFEYTRQQAVLRNSLGIRPVAVPAGSGILYSGIPVFAMAKWGKRTFKNIIRYFSREKALPKENAQPGEFNTVYTDEGKTIYRYRHVAYKNGQIRILGDNEETPAGWDLYTLAESYNFMPVASDENALHANTLAELILRESSPVREDLVFVLASGANQVYKVRAFNKLRQLQYSLPAEAEIIEVSQKLDDVTRVALSRADALDIEDSMQRVVSEGGNAAQMAGSEHHVLLEGVSEEDLLNINKNKVSAALYDASEMDQFLGQMQVSTTRNGHTKYSGLLPIYLRLADRSLSEGPRLYFVLNKGQSFLVPRGFVLAMDEKGQMKFVAKDSEAAIRNSSRSLFKFLDKSIRLLGKPMAKRGHVVFEQPLALAELAGLAHVLAADTKASKVGVVGVRQQDSFESLMLVVALVAGADLGASMAGEFKNMFEDWASVAIFISGFGYLSPKLANLFNPWIAKHGYYQTVKAVLLTMVGISALGFVGGLTGTFNLQEAGIFGKSVSYLFAPVAILMASILSTISSPIMKSAYKDPTQYAAKNMGFTTMKGLSRAMVTLLPWVVGLGVMLGVSLAPEGSIVASWLPQSKLNWSLLVPVMLGGSLFGFHLLQKSRLATEASEVKTSPISKQEAKQIYKQLFKPGLASTVARVALVYFTYAAINSVIFSGEMKMLYPDNGLLITSIGLGMSFAVRKLADWMIKNKVITDDQLTGIGLPLMLFGVMAYLGSPAGSIGMWLSWAAMYLSTPVFGVVENSRMMNNVGRYYAAERERIRKDKKMTADEKKQAAEWSKKIEEAVKLQAAGAYNSANSKGLFPILLLTGLFLFLKDLPAVAAVAQPWMDVINGWFGDPTVDANGNVLNDYAIYRLGAVLSVFTASLLVKQNWGMVKDGWSRLFRSTALSQKTIDAYNRGELPAEKVYKSLRFDTDAIATNLQRITTEINELQVSVRGSMRALESEPRLQKLMNRLVWVNNRLKASLEGSQLPVDQAVANLHALRSSAVMFKKVLEFNDVSDGLKAQAAAFVQSVQSIHFEEDAVVEKLTQKALSYSSQVRNASAFMDTVLALEESYLQGDLKRFKLHYDSLKRMLRVVEFDKEELDKLYQSVLKTMESGVYSVQDMNLGYLPEVKMSLVAQIPGLAREAKSIFDGTDVSDYELVKVGYLRTLKVLLQEKKSGLLYDGMNGDFALYYQKAVETLDQYAASTDDAERVQKLRRELDQVYTDYMGEAPMPSSVAAHASENSGLWDTLTKWWNEFLTWLKGGDSSGNSGPAAPADGPDIE